MIQRRLGGSSTFLTVDDSAALDCVLNSRCNLLRHLHSGPTLQALTVPPQVKKSPGHFLHRESLGFFTSSSRPSSSFLRASTSVGSLL